MPAGGSYCEDTKTQRGRDISLAGETSEAAEKRSATRVTTQIAFAPLTTSTVHLIPHALSKSYTPIMTGSRMSSSSSSSNGGGEAAGGIGDGVRAMMGEGVSRGGRGVGVYEGGQTGKSGMEEKEGA